MSKRAATDVQTLQALNAESLIRNLPTATSAFAKCYDTQRGSIGIPAYGWRCCVNQSVEAAAARSN